MKLVSESDRSIQRLNETIKFKNMAISRFQSDGAASTVQNFYTSGTQNWFLTVAVKEFCSHCSSVFDTMASFRHHCPARTRLHPSLITFVGAEWKIECRSVCENNICKRAKMSLRKLNMNSVNQKRMIIPSSCTFRSHFPRENLLENNWKKTTQYEAFLVVCEADSRTRGLPWKFC